MSLEICAIVQVNFFSFNYKVICYLLLFYLSISQAFFDNTSFFCKNVSIISISFLYESQNVYFFAATMSISVVISLHVH